MKRVQLAAALLLAPIAAVAYPRGRGDVAHAAEFAQADTYDGGPGVTNPQPGTGLYDGGIAPDKPGRNPGIYPNPGTDPGVGPGETPHMPGNPGTNPGVPNPPGTPPGVGGSGGPTG